MDAKLFWKKHGSKILTGMGIAEMLGALYCAVKSTPDAMLNIERLKQKKADVISAEQEIEVDIETIDLSKKEIIQVTWRCYISTMVMTAVSIGCFIGAETMHQKECLALATTCELAKKALDEYKTYKDEVKKEIGEEKAQEISNRTSQRIVDQMPKPDKNSILIVGSGDVLFCDSISGRYFRSDMQSIKRAVNELNHRLLREGYIFLNDLYEAIGITGTTIGDMIGWQLERQEDLIELSFDAIVINDEPCLEIKYDEYPCDIYFKR